MYNNEKVFIDLKMLTNKIDFMFLLTREEQKS